MDLHQRMPPVDSPVAQKFVEALGQRLAAEMPHARLPFTFSLIAEDRRTHEPIALPGGYIFVPTALFLAAQDEAEFAGMLAHSMEHVAQRHGLSNTQGGVLMNTAAIPLIFLGGWAGGNSERLAVPIPFLERQRNSELDADAWAVQTMARAGFDPQALLRYIARVQTPEREGPPKLYSPLPDLNVRVEALRSAIAKIAQAGDPTPSSSAFAAAQEEMRRLPVPSSPRSDTPPSLCRKLQ